MYPTISTPDVTVQTGCSPQTDRNLRDPNKQMKEHAMAPYQINSVQK